MPPLYSFGKVTVGPLLNLIWQPEVEGRENIPDSGGLIFASNHLSVADEVLSAVVVPRHLAFWAKSEYFKGTGPRGLFVKHLLQALGAIPVERAGGRAALAAFDAAIPVLQSGGQVVVYPEGTRSPDGRLYKGRTGVARLATMAGVPVIPVGVLGTDRMQPIGQRLPKFRPSGAVIRFGKPMDFTGRATDTLGLRAITDEVMAEIQKLTGQEYVPNYAPPKTS
ncbi:lysophospholipid acyltransferase family protein [Catenuloplanes atrovinosus]|uniref:1-acyl-sn-glycerol-3-phosphate acyltransferase n=1 Tax=Catenuloplanes atrovinosus TaxID=137266 RepID=A0AAE3YRQ6_9ACTN|nr:lysophospholipid acyltransferase family protein [Catenuloplanes atrovinosus]MDR7278659.1 1-acyl-sn-glycerol-3-phosphate acyltransferase [Catenuloplanes atrovinosus]